MDQNAKHSSLGRLTATELHEAFRCDGMNGQRLNCYKMSYAEGVMNSSATGDGLKGLITTSFDVAHKDDEPRIWEATFEGDLRMP